MTPAASARRLLEDRAYDELKELIQNGALPGGSFLSERALARQLRMSTTPVRLALGRLALEGFVSISPQHGVVVREPSIQEVVDLFDLREALESFVARRLAGKLAAEQARTLKENLKRQEEAARDGDTVRLTRLDTEFHLLLCRFLGNREIELTLWRLRDKLHRVILRVMSRLPGRPAEAVREHAAIADAILRGQAERAADRIVRHLEFGKRFLVSG